MGSFIRVLVMCARFVPIASIDTLDLTICRDMYGSIIRTKTETTQSFEKCWRNVLKDQGRLGDGVPTLADQSIDAMHYDYRCSYDDTVQNSKQVAEFPG